MADLVAPDLIPIPDVTCANPSCGRPLAWRVGVGRYVISHSDGQDVCSRATVKIADEDRDAARRAYDKADREFALARSKA